MTPSKETYAALLANLGQIVQDQLVHLRLHQQLLVALACQIRLRRCPIGQRSLIRHANADQHGFERVAVDEQLREVLALGKHHLALLRAIKGCVSSEKEIV